MNPAQKTVDMVVLGADNEKKDAELTVLRRELGATNEKKDAELTVMRLKLRDATRKTEEQAAEIKELKKLVRNYLLRERKRKREDVAPITDVAIVSEDLTGPEATQQLGAYKRFALEHKLNVSGLDFKVGRLVPDRLLRLAAIVNKLGPEVQNFGQNGQGRVECLD